MMLLSILHRELDNTGNCDSLAVCGVYWLYTPVCLLQIPAEGGKYEVCKNKPLFA